jgi:hypothetical protein
MKCFERNPIYVIIMFVLSGTRKCAVVGRKVPENHGTTAKRTERGWFCSVLCGWPQLWGCECGGNVSRYGQIVDWCYDDVHFYAIGIVEI